MFEFITISNGVAVVQHAPSGNVYRFRPVHPGIWTALTPQRTDGGVPPGCGSGSLAEEARAFAEVFASSIFDVPPEPRPHEQAARDESRRTFRLLLKSALG